MNAIKSSCTKNQIQNQILQNDFTPRGKENIANLIPSKAWIRNMGAGTTKKFDSNRNTSHRNRILVVTDTMATQEIRANPLDTYFRAYKCATQPQTTGKRLEEDIASSNQSNPSNKLDDADELHLGLTINRRLKPQLTINKFLSTSSDESSELLTSNTLLPLNSTGISTTCVQMDKLSNDLRNICVPKSKCLLLSLLRESSVKITKMEACSSDLFLISIQNQVQFINKFVNFINFQSCSFQTNQRQMKAFLTA